MQNGRAGRLHPAVGTARRPCSWSPAAAAPTPSRWQPLPHTSPAAATYA